MESAGSQKKTKDAVPRAAEVNTLKQRESKNFVKDNVNKAIFELAPPQKPEVEAGGAKSLNKNYGKVPSYINKFKNQKEEEIKQKA